METTFTIEVAPLSSNHYYRRGRFSTYMSGEGRAYKENIGYLLLPKVKKMLKGHLGIDIVFYVPNLRGDGDNLLKAFLDSLQGIVFENDRQIRWYTFCTILDKEKPRITARVWELPENWVMLRP